MYLHAFGCIQRKLLYIIKLSYMNLILDTDFTDTRSEHYSLLLDLYQFTVPLGFCGVIY